MTFDNCIYRLDKTSQQRFFEADEIFSDTQLGVVRQNDDLHYYIVVSGRIAICVRSDLEVSLRDFYAKTWIKYRDKQNLDCIEKLYLDWYTGLDEITDVYCAPAARSTLQYYAATGTMPVKPAAPPLPVAPPPVAPPPPNRPGLIPGLVPPPGPSIHGHLPFQDITTAFEIFYRFEAYPTSIRVRKGMPGSYTAGTFASPSSELLFLPTGFAAVARNALPSFFPAVFRYELAPAACSNVLCGAVVPMYGMSGGGVEVMFVDKITNNRGAIADPAIVLPL